MNATRKTTRWLCCLLAARAGSATAFPNNLDITAAADATAANLALVGWYRRGDGARHSEKTKRTWKMKKTMLCAVAVAALCACGGENAWSGKKVAYLGDSITDARHIGCTSNYWNFLEAKLGIVPLVYGINGHQMKHLVGQAAKLKAEHPDDVDAIFVFAGTNDFNSNTPLGSWYEETTETVNRNGKQVALKHRGFVYGEGTFRGRINSLMKCLRENFPAKPVYLLTPVHRGYATFGAGNVQPDESYANEIGEYVDAYVDVVKEAGNVWAVTVIDINAESGLFPLFSSHAQFFHNAQTDMLHPNNAGHERIADAIAARLLSRVCP